MKGTIIYLVGFMGAGKTEVGRRLAELLSWPFVDLDQEIERREGKTISEIFRERGEAFFRELERQELLRVSREKNTVVAVGGGAFCVPEIQEIIAGTGMSVWLDAPLDLLLARCKAAAGSRPLLTTRQEMSLLLERRRPYYEKATLRLQVAGLDVDGVARRILDECQSARH